MVICPIPSLGAKQRKPQRTNSWQPHRKIPRMWKRIPAIYGPPKENKNSKIKLHPYNACRNASISSHTWVRGESFAPEHTKSRRWKKKKKKRQGKMKCHRQYAIHEKEKKIHSIITKERSGVSRGRTWALKDRQATLPQESKVLMLKGYQRSLASVVVVVTSGRRKRRVSKVLLCGWLV